MQTEIIALKTLGLLMVKSYNMENWQMTLIGMVLCIIGGMIILYQKHRENP